MIDDLGNILKVYKGFNPYFYWMIIFITSEAVAIEIAWKLGFNPYFYWMIIFIIQKTQIIVIIGIVVSILIFIG